MKATDLAGRVMKVNHAGEHGAVSIYTGQIFMARLTAKSLLPELLAFKADEEKHRTQESGANQTIGCVCLYGGKISSLFHKCSYGPTSQLI